MAHDGCSARSTRWRWACSTERYNARLRHHPRGAGRVLGPQPPARRASPEGRPVRRRDRAGRDPAAQGRPVVVQRGRGHPRRHHRRVAGQAAPRVRKDGTSPRARRRRSPTALRGRRDEQGQGRGARADLARRDRRARRRRRPRTPRCRAAGQRHRAALPRRASRPPTSTSSRSTRRSRPWASPPPRARHRPDDKVNVNGGAIASATRSACPGRGSPCTSPRAQAPRRRRRRGRAVRRRRPGRRPDPARQRR
jgi:hypothetical protein